MSENVPQMVVYVDGEAFNLSAPTVSGADLKSLAGKDSVYQLFQEESGEGPDKFIPDHQAITVKDGIHFYTVPPAVMGA